MTVTWPRCTFGGMAADRWEHDPKTLGFMLARYKFVARMLRYYRNVLEVGCNDGFGARVVRQHVGSLMAVDIDAWAIAGAQARNSPDWPIEFAVHDFLKAPLPGFDGAYCLDVLEHIQPADEAAFLYNLSLSAPVVVIGMPSLESQAYASPGSKEGHVNCKTSDQLRFTVSRYWDRVFMFGMNDEVLHTGFAPMTQYLFALGVD